MDRPHTPADVIRAMVEVVEGIKAEQGGVDVSRRMLDRFLQIRDLARDGQAVARDASARFPGDGDAFLFRLGMTRIELGVNAFVVVQPHSDAETNQVLVDAITADIQELVDHFADMERISLPAEPTADGGPHLH